MAYIYALLDPATKEVRYVGKSSDPWTRIKRHLSKFDNTHKSKWIESLVRKGNAPILKILELVQENDWRGREKYWISHFRNYGGSLTNLAVGGEGLQLGSKHTDETKQKISVAIKRLYDRGTFLGSKGSKWSPQSIAERTKNQTGLKRRPETIERIRKARQHQIPPMLGKRQPESQKEKMRQWWKSRKEKSLQLQ